MVICPPSQILQHFIENADILNAWISCTVSRIFIFVKISAKWLVRAYSTLKLNTMDSGIPPTQTFLEISEQSLVGIL